jgi:hypothetical protein
MSGIGSRILEGYQVRPSFVWRGSELIPYVQEFRFHGCASGPVIVTVRGTGGDVTIPPRTQCWRGLILEVGDPRLDTEDDGSGISGLGDGLLLLGGEIPPVPHDNQWPTASPTTETVLNHTPGRPFQLLFPHQYTHPLSQSFFFADEKWTFFVEYIGSTERLGSFGRDVVTLSAIDHVRSQVSGQIAARRTTPASAGFVRPVLRIGSVFGAEPQQGVSVVAARAAEKYARTKVVPAALRPIKGNPSYRFYTFCHPRVCDFIHRLEEGGLEGLLHWEPGNPVQDPQDARDHADFFNLRYQPDAALVDLDHPPSPSVEFGEISPYGEDNQNLFLYCIARGAAALTAAGKFDDADRLWRGVFDPADASGDPAPTRFWKYLPFRKASQQSLADFLALLAGNGKAAEDARAAVQDWADHPFEPWRVARRRPLALMKTVVRYYLENVLAEADQLYARAAEQEMLLRSAGSYIYALEILGPSPAPLTPDRQADAARPHHTYADFEADPSSFGLLPEALENALPPLPATDSEGRNRFPFTTATQFAFCLPRDDSFDKMRRHATAKLAGIRTGLAFDGTPQQFSVFGQRIDPMLLVRAAAAGVDLTTALGSGQVPRSPYRFSILLQKAKEVLAELRGTSASLLAALTEDAAETLGELRTEHEITLLAAMRKVKEAAKQEAEQSLAGLQSYLQVVTKRNQYYGSRTLMNPGEIVGVELTVAATILQIVAQGIGLTASGVKEIPNFTTGVAGMGGSPYFVVTEGGGNVGEGLSQISTALNMMGTILHAGAGLATTIAGYQRRQDEWNMLAETTAVEIAQVSSQIAAQQARVDAAVEDLNVLERQQDNAQAVKEFLSSRVNNPEFRQYRVAQLSSVCHQGYLLAFAAARSAERAFQFEQGYFDGTRTPIQSFIQFGYWQNNFKGVTAADQLGLALQQLEAAYLELPREKETRITVSLALTNPLALESLRRTGSTGPFTLPEELIAREVPESYFVRISGLRVTIPFVAGPYTTVPFRVDFHRHSIRLTDELDNGRYERRGASDDRFYDSIGPVETMYTSTGRDDPGLHPGSESDGRRGWFEGFGFASEIEVSFPIELSPIEPTTIADVLLECQVRFRKGGDEFRRRALAHLAEYFGHGYQMLRARNDFPTEWYRFLNPPGPTADHVLNLPITQDHFPMAPRGSPVSLTSVLVLVAWKSLPNTAIPAASLHFRMRPTASELAGSGPTGEIAALLQSLGHVLPLQLVGYDTKRSPVSARLDPTATPSLTLVASEVPTEYVKTVSIGGNDVLRLNADAIDDVAVLCHYAVTPAS